MIRSLFSHDHAHECHITFLCKGNQRISSCICIAGLASGRIIIQICIISMKRIDHLVMIVQRCFGFMLVGRWNRIGLCPCDHTECLILICFCCDQRHVMCARPVILVRQSVWIIEMRIRTTQFCGTLIHHLGKLLHRAPAI